LLYIARPVIQIYRASMLFTFAALAATILWSAVSYPPFANSDSRSHSVGAGFGTFLVVFAIPSVAIFFLALHFFLIRSLRQLSNLQVPSRSLA
jgi:hypothetical protein